MRKVESANWRGRHHRQRLRQCYPGLCLDIHHLPHRQLLSMIGLSRVTGRGPDSGKVWSEEIVARQRLLRRVSPQLGPDLKVKELGESLGESIGQCAHHDGAVVVVGLVIPWTINLLQTNRIFNKKMLLSFHYIITQSFYLCHFLII